MEERREKKHKMRTNGYFLGRMFYRKYCVACDLIAALLTLLNPHLRSFRLYGMTVGMSVNDKRQTLPSMNEWAGKRRSGRNGGRKSWKVREKGGIGSAKRFSAPQILFFVDFADNLFNSTFICVNGPDLSLGHH